MVQLLANEDNPDTQTNIDHDFFKNNPVNMKLEILINSYFQCFSKQITILKKTDILATCQHIIICCCSR